MNQTKHNLFTAVLLSNLEIQSTVCRHSPAGFHDRSGSGGSWIHLQSKGTKVTYMSVCVCFFLGLVPYVTFNTADLSW